MFVFDGDERPAELRDQIVAASQGRAKFLPVRELENLFLRATAIQPVLAEICIGANRAAPTVEQVEADLQALLGDLANSKLYRMAVDEPDPTRVVGSQVLDSLWWKWGLAAYDKVEDGPRLVAGLLMKSPEDLQPFMSLVIELSSAIRVARAAGQ